MKRLVILITLVLVSASMAAVPAIELGMPEAMLIELEGFPASKATIGSKAIYSWPDMQVSLVEGKVSQIRLRDRIAVRQNAIERAAVETQKKMAARSEAMAAEKQSSAATRRSAVDAQYAEDSRLSARLVFCL